MMFGFVNEFIENVVDLLSNVGSEVQKFSVDAMKGSFQKISFTGVFRIKKF